jgi:hypothetical protein
MRRGNCCNQAFTLIDSSYLWLPMGKQVEPRQKMSSDEYKQTKTRESEDGAESRRHPPMRTATLPDRNSNTCDRYLKQRYGNCKTDKVQPRNVADTHHRGLYRELRHLLRTGVSTNYGLDYSGSRSWPTRPVVS